MSLGFPVRLGSVLLAAVLMSCSTKEADSGAASEGGASTCDDGADGDADGINDCEEVDLGTDPSVSDSDGDGMSDGDEIDCDSDPLDALDVCYECGWPKNDPGSLESTGAQEGDVIANLVMVDQCGEDVSIWDFYGEYHIIYKTAAW